jgi:hypothetical protein
MGGEKIRLAARAVEEGIGRLRPDDRFCVVVYDDEVDVIVGGRLATPDARRHAVDQLSRIDARGTTDLSGGWLAGCEQVAEALLATGVNRTLLLSDGLANAGITDRDELARHAAELRARGVSTSTFGVGDDFDEVLLDAMAQSGGGHFYDIATAAAIRDHMSSEVGETLEVVAREAVLELDLPEGVHAESLGAFPARQAGGRTVIALGDLVSGQQLEVPLRIAFRLGEAGQVLPGVVTLSDRDGVLDGAGARLAWEYASDSANDAQPRDREVERLIASVFAARARRDAVDHNRRGDYRSARRALDRTARRIRSYAGHDAELGAIAQRLDDEAAGFEHAMTKRSLKAAYATSHYALQSRDAAGQARRSR